MTQIRRNLPNLNTMTTRELTQHAAKVTFLYQAYATKPWRTNSLHLQPAETMDTTMEVEVEELCTNNVASTPSITPAMGLLNSTVLLRASPACLPETKSNLFVCLKQRAVYLFAWNKQQYAWNRVICLFAWNKEQYVCLPVTKASLFAWNKEQAVCLPETKSNMFVCL